MYQKVTLNVHAVPLIRPSFPKKDRKKFSESQLRLLKKANIECV